MLIGVAGRGWYSKKRVMAPVEILPGTDNPYSRERETLARGCRDSWFAHLAFEVPGEKTSNEWLEPVTDEEYNKLEQIK